MTFFFLFPFPQHWRIYTITEGAHECSKSLCPAVFGRVDHCFRQCSRYWYAGFPSRLSWWYVFFNVKEKYAFFIFNRFFVGFELTVCCSISGLFNMLSDSSHEIRQQADSALSEFLQEIKNSPVRHFICLNLWLNNEVVDHASLEACYQKFIYIMFCSFVIFWLEQCYSWSL